MPTIPGTLRMTATRVPDAEALAFEGRLYTYRELDEAVDRTAAVLADAGLGHGDCAVVARPHPDCGESIVAVVTPRDGASPSLDELRAFCAGRIAEFKLPHDLVLGPVPRNPSGKILKHQVRAAVLEQRVAP